MYEHTHVPTCRLLRPSICEILVYCAHPRHIQVEEGGRVLSVLKHMEYQALATYQQV